MVAHPKILKLARLALDVSQDELAAIVGIARRTLQKLESCEGETTFRTIQAVQRALEGRGVVFLGESEVLGPGFRLPRGYLRGADSSQSGDNNDSRTN
jgi:transcriptional regulator with XRE-family HTH domain